MYCPSCGSVVPSEAYYCPYCGKPLPRTYVESLTTPSALIYLFPDHFLPPLRFMHFMFGEKGFKSPTSNVSVNERNASIMMIASSLIWLKENNLVYMDLSEERVFSGLIKFPAVVVRKAFSSSLGDGSLEDMILNKVLMRDKPISVYNITRRILDFRGVWGVLGLPSSSSFILKLVEGHLIQKGIIKVDASILSKKVRVDENRILGLSKNLEDVKTLLSNFKQTNALLFQRIIENIDRGFYSKLPITWLVFLVFIALMVFLRVRPP
ncbi:zinc ribbon domain-containing protein [Candidatus Bathyarchaeota archaeon]|nr:zinc ribbon domain-containing protein [Candidatus Bathyarchaeota archaeon]MBS7617760.1 zinc ribbon domain-containing protein [Candidatus Bathyarchaeota archaeon]